MQIGRNDCFPTFEKKAGVPKKSQNGSPDYSVWDSQDCLPFHGKLQILPSAIV
jgi:hypothetical protein